MKKYISFIILFLIIILSSCSVQEKMNPIIFMERFKENYPEFIISENDYFVENNNYICFFSDNGDTDYALKIYTDADENIKKICLACSETDKTERIKFVCEAIVKTYAPHENSELIINSLFADERNYHNSQWYRYTSSLIEGTAYFSVENMKIATDTDAGLTLKENDIIFR